MTGHSSALCMQAFSLQRIDSSRSKFIDKMKANLQSEVNTGGNEERDTLDIQELLTKPIKL